MQRHFADFFVPLVLGLSPAFMAPQNNFSVLLLNFQPHFAMFPANLPRSITATLSNGANTVTEALELLGILGLIDLG